MAFPVDIKKEKPVILDQSNGTVVNQEFKLFTWQIT